MVELPMHDTNVSGQAAQEPKSSGCAHERLVD